MVNVDPKKSTKMDPYVSLLVTGAKIELYLYGDFFSLLSICKIRGIEMHKPKWVFLMIQVERDRIKCFSKNLNKNMDTDFDFKLGETITL